MRVFLRVLCSCLCICLWGEFVYTVDCIPAVHFLAPLPVQSGFLFLSFYFCLFIFYFEMESLISCL